MSRELGTFNFIWSPLLIPNSRYLVHQLDYQLQRIGSLTLAMGQLELVSEMTRESTQLVFGVLHLGGWDFHCCIQPFSGRRYYSDLKANLFGAFQQASAARTVLTMAQAFGDQSYGLHSLFDEERHRIMHLLTQATLTRLDQLYTQVYRDNYGVLMAFHRDGLSVPQELQVAAGVALSHRLMTCLKGLEQESSDPANANAQLGTSYLSELKAIAAEANHLNCQLNLSEATVILERLILRLLWQLLYDFNLATVETSVRKLERLLDLGQQLHQHFVWDRAQELYFHCLHQQIKPRCLRWVQLHTGTNPEASVVNSGPAIALAAESEPILDLSQLRRLLQLGQKLAVDVNYWLNQLP